ncbi:MAG TPA: hypothetical protein VGJ86_14185 [Acidimicrobiales bacterium]|jgi:hypothetical protein
MAGLSLRDRFFTPRVARAMMSPLGILLAGGGVALGIVAGLPVAGAVVIGAGAWGARVAAAMRVGMPGERIDPFTLNEPWRGFVQDALSARGRFREAADRTRSGPLRDTLREISARLDDGVDECWRIARQGEALVRSRRDIDSATIERELAEAEAGHASNPDDRLWAQTAESLRAQKATSDRMDKVIKEAHSELRLLDARMGEAVVRALELSAQATAPDSALSLSSDVDGMVTDLEALRQALEETHGLTGGDAAGGLYQDPAPG